MNKLIIGLTGGIGSGKTAVSDWFQTQHITIVDADTIAHQLTQKGSPLLTVLKNTFGDWVIDNNGNYNRPAMRAYVFEHSDELKKLNDIMHPAIRDEIIHQLTQANSPYVILSVPLLFESYGKDNSLMNLCQHFLAVDVNEKIQLERASKRDNTNLDNIKAIIAKQISRDDRLQIAKQLTADIVENNSDLNNLYEQLLPLHQKYLAMTNKKS